MRNYVIELIRIGYSEEAISKQANVSLSHIHKIAIGKVRDKAGTKTYEAIRNANRRLARQYARQGGMTSKEADTMRRDILNPERETRIRNTTKHLKSKVNQTILQYYIYGEFKFTGEVIGDPEPNRFQHGFTGSKPNKRNTDDARNEAIENAKHILNGTDEFGYGDTKDWALVKLIEQGWIKRVLHKSA